MEKFELFDKFKQRVNVFLGTFLTEKICYNVYDILKLVCSLWHGQSSVEKVFSVNQEHLVDNLLEDSLIALRAVNDHMLVHNLPPININITKEVMANVKFPRQGYMAGVLEEKKNDVNVKSRKRKRLTEQVEVIAKKKNFISSSENFIKRSDKCTIQAEVEKNVLHMPNSLKELVK